MAVCWNVVFFIHFIFRKRCATHEWTKNPFIRPSTIHLSKHIRSSRRVIIDRLLSASEIKQSDAGAEIQFDFFRIATRGLLKCELFLSTDEKSFQTRIFIAKHDATDSRKIFRRIYIIYKYSVAVFFDI